MILSAPQVTPALPETEESSCLKKLYLYSRTLHRSTPLSGIQNTTVIMTIRLTISTTIRETMPLRDSSGQPRFKPIKRWWSIGSLHARLATSNNIQV
jgi:hypothetical protein